MLGTLSLQTVPESVKEFVPKHMFHITTQRMLKQHRLGMAVLPLSGEHALACTCWRCQKSAGLTCPSCLTH